MKIKEHQEGSARKIELVGELHMEECGDYEFPLLFFDGKELYHSLKSLTIPPHLSDDTKHFPYPRPFGRCRIIVEQIIDPVEIAREVAEKAETRREHARQDRQHEDIAKAIKAFKRTKPSLRASYLNQTVEDLEIVAAAGGRPARFAAAAIVLKTSRHTHHHGSENHCEEHGALHEYDWGRTTCYPH